MDFLEHGGDGADGHELDALAEAMDGRQVAVAVQRAQEGDPRLVDQRAAAAGNLAQHRAHAPRRQRPGNGGHQLSDRGVVHRSSAGGSAAGPPGCAASTTRLARSCMSRTSWASRSVIGDTGAALRRAADDGSGLPFDLAMRNTTRRLNAGKER